MSDSDENSDEDILLMLIETMKHSGQTEPPEFFKVRGLDTSDARQLLKKLSDDDAKPVERYPQEGDKPDEYGPRGADDLSSDQVSRQLFDLIREISKPHPVSWFSDKIGADSDIVNQELMRLCESGMCETFENTCGTGPLFGRPGMDPTSDTYQLRSSENDEEVGLGYDAELIFPDGTSSPVKSTVIEGECTVAASEQENDIIVFVDGEFSFMIDQYVKIFSPLSRSIAVSSAGYIAYNTGEHRENVFNVRTWEGEPVIQRVSESARVPSFTPDGDYVAYWRLTDKTIYCYDVKAATDSGQFDTFQFWGRSFDVEGVEYNEEPAFAVYNTDGSQEDELRGYISPSGDLLHSEDSS